uniref:Metalloendopeptidase n=1 Tax=Heterorhabditis bacteriophora TaxID=37862 RepID=A0A1I7WVB5_HETBA
MEKSHEVKEDAHREIGPNHVPKGGTDPSPMEKLLIHSGSSDTFENRLIVKNILDTINMRQQKFRKNGAQELQQKFNPRPKNNYSKPDIMEINKNISEWLFEGDIMLTPKQAYALLAERGGDALATYSSCDQKKRAVQTNPFYFWNPAVAINYTLDIELSSSVASLIDQGVQYWQDNTCLSFKKNANGLNRLRFYQGSGCWSYIGKQASWNSQDISIGSGCNSLGTVTHEIGHALGFYHTQSRYDRDNWLKVDYSNIASNAVYNFEKMTPETETHFNQKYDFGSVMQYNPCETFIHD